MCCPEHAAHCPASAAPMTTCRPATSARQRAWRYSQTAPTSPAPLLFGPIASLPPRVRLLGSHGPPPDLVLQWLVNNHGCCALASPSEICGLEGECSYSYTGDVL
ncbi:unnamed protein product [Miscanthus lutarioriparius]|uniref:Uncharacterized protein n=1 Tax=Miscanthus lutarioriparius TaxID=422564 RepID=A0A811MHC1_9POAL|nr:unnamed protein product [Miscanthus lutarioriparius]